MSTLKLIGCVAIMMGCFAVLYPRFMHPLVLRLFGLHKGNADKDQPIYPPGYGRPGMTKPKPEDITRTGAAPPSGDPKPMRPGPHPGMRAAAEMNRQSQGSGRGMMGVVLPMYAVGIIVYLVYTLVKVFNKRSDSRGRYAQWTQEAQTAFGMNDSADSQPAQQTDYQKLMSGASPGKDLEQLLLRADDPSVSTSEMRELQRRLEETEAQMHRILAAMQNVHQKVSTVVQPQAAGTVQGAGPASPTANSGTEQPAQTEKLSTADQVPETPDTESYEVIKNASSSSDASPLTELPDLPGSSVETIAAASTDSSSVSIKTVNAGEEEASKDEMEDVVLVDKTSKEEEEDGESSVRQRKPIPVK